MGILTSTGNAAPNYVPYNEARTPFGLNWQRPAILAGVVKQPIVSIEQQLNNAPYVNAQTYWAAGVVRTPQGLVRRR